MAPRDRAGPLAVDVDEPDAGGLEPAQDLLGLLGGGGRHRAGRRARRSRRTPRSSATNWWASAPGGITPAAASRPWRTTWTAQRPSSSRRAATTSGQRVSAVSRWVRAAARTKAASRSRWTPASSNRSSAASAAIRRVDRVDHLVGSAQQRVAQLPHDGGVRRRRRRCRRTARGSGPSRPGRTATRDGSPAEPVGALADREGLVQRGQALLGGLAGRERAEVVGVVVEHPAHQGQPRPRLAGQLDEVHLLGEPGAPVVARLVLGDQPQLADLGLERGGAHDAVDRWSRGRPSRPSATGSRRR